MLTITKTVSITLVAAVLFLSGCGGSESGGASQESTFSDEEKTLINKSLSYIGSDTLTYMHDDKKMYSYEKFSDNYYYWDHMDGNWDYDEENHQLVLNFNDGQTVRFSDEGSYYKTLSQSLPYDANVVVDTALMQKVIQDFYSQTDPVPNSSGFTSTQMRGNWEISSNGISSTITFYDDGSISEEGSLSGISSSDVWRVSDGKLLLEYYISGIKIEYRTVTNIGQDSQGCILADVIQSNSGYNRQWRMCKQ